MHHSHHPRQTCVWGLNQEGARGTLNLAAKLLSRATQSEEGLSLTLGCAFCHARYEISSSNISDAFPLESQKRIHEMSYLKAKLNIRCTNFKCLWTHRRPDPREN